MEMLRERLVAAETEIERKTAYVTRIATGSECLAQRKAVESLQILRQALDIADNDDERQNANDCIQRGDDEHNRQVQVKADAAKFAHLFAGSSSTSPPRKALEYFDGAFALAQLFDCSALVDESGFGIGNVETVSELAVLDSNLMHFNWSEYISGWDNATAEDRALVLLRLSCCWCCAGD